MFVLYITLLLTFLITVELKLPTLCLTRPQKSRRYAALTNHQKLRLLSTFDEKSFAKDQRKNEANDEEKERKTLFSVNEYAMP